MTKYEVKAELRRSACEDENPYFSVDEYAFYKTDDFTCAGEWQMDMEYNDLRTFYLLVAEAL